MANLAEEPTCFVFKTKGAKKAANGTLEENKDDAPWSCRKPLYQKFWARLEDRLNGGIDFAHLQTLDKIRSFVFSASADQYSGRIPSALIVTGPNASTRLFEKFHSQLLQNSDCVYVSISPAESSNLKSLVRNLIIKTTQRRGAEDHENAADATNRPKLLDYDLRILHDFCAKHDINRVVIDLQNSEAFDVAVLADFLMLLYSWIDRLPIVLLFGIATSVDEFQDRLPTAVTRCLRGEAYDIANAHEIIELIFETAAADGELHFGPSFGNFFLQRVREDAQNPEKAIQTIKYSYMCHFFGNATSVFLDQSLKFSDVLPELFDAVRNFNSFQSLAEELLENEKGGQVRELLESNEALFRLLPTHIAKLHDTVTWLIGALRIFTKLGDSLSFGGSPSLSALYVSTLAAGCIPLALLGRLLLYVKKISSEKLTEALSLIYDTLISMPAIDNDISPDDFADLQHELVALLNAHNGGLGPLQGPAIEVDEPRRGREKHQLAQNRAAYSKLVLRFHNLIQNYFEKCPVPTKGQFPYEICFYDTKALHQSSMTPRPRFSIERALASPHDYLGCNCCAQTTEGVLSTQPATAIMYQLYLESGTLINVSDLFSAFSEIIRPHCDDEQMVMALCFRSLATLRYLGMLKSSRRRIDHIGKTMWKGL